LKHLILYRERDYGNATADAESVGDNLFATDPQISQRVLDYMKNGRVLIEFVSPTADPFNPGHLVRSTIYSDGTYVWDGIVLHWIEKYKVRLPDDFIKHAELRRGGDVADFDPEALLEEVKHAAHVFVRRR
jgi:hypothetical protein